MVEEVGNPYMRCRTDLGGLWHRYRVPLAEKTSVRLPSWFVCGQSRGSGYYSRLVIERLRVSYGLFVHLLIWGLSEVVCEATLSSRLDHERLDNELRRLRRLVFFSYRHGNHEWR